jgi:hypothetical protein
MIYLFYPNDSTLQFLDSLLDLFFEEIELGHIIVIRCEASLVAYEYCKEQLKMTEKNSTVVFVGHGTPDFLYGGENNSFPKKPLFSIDDMHFLVNKKAIFMSCYSEQLLRKSRQHRAYSDCIGFGLLPSDIKETIGKNYLEKLNLNPVDICEFQKSLVEVFAKIISIILNENLRTEELVDKVKLFINMKINNNVLKNKNIKLANLLYYFYSEMHFD